MNTTDYDSHEPPRDRFYGHLPRHRFSGRLAGIMNRLFICACSLRTAEVNDNEAIAMLLEAAGNNRGVFHSFAEMFAHRDWHGDPLLSHVANLVVAAEARTRPSPVDPSDEEAVRFERHLLTLTDAEAFLELTRRSPSLVALQHRVADTDWLAELRIDGDSSPPPIRDLDDAVAAGVVPPVANPLQRWAVRRAARRGEERFATNHRLQRIVAEGRQNQLVIEALDRTYKQLVGPSATTDDPLMKTYVAYMMGWPHLLAIAGIDLDIAPVL